MSLSYWYSKFWSRAARLSDDPASAIVEAKIAKHEARSAASASRSNAAETRNLRDAFEVFRGMQSSRQAEYMQIFGELVADLQALKHSFTALHAEHSEAVEALKLVEDAVVARGTTAAEEQKIVADRIGSLQQSVNLLHESTKLGELKRELEQRYSSLCEDLQRIRGTVGTIESAQKELNVGHWETERRKDKGDLEEAFKARLEVIRDSMDVRLQYLETIGRKDSEKWGSQLEQNHQRLVLSELRSLSCFGVGRAMEGNWKESASILSYVNDLPIWLCAGDLICDTLRTAHKWDAHIAALVDSRKWTGVAIDAGGHVGYNSIVLSRAFTNVLSFEPNHKLFSVLCRNAEIYGNIIPFNLALSSRATMMSFAPWDAQESEGDVPARDYYAIRNQGALVFCENGSGVNTIAARPLDSFELPTVGLIKVDCQGSDGEVLCGALNTIRRDRPTIVFEWETELAKVFGWTPERAFEMMDQLGYEVKVLYKHNQKQIDYLALPRE